MGPQKTHYDKLMACMATNTTQQSQILQEQQIDRRKSLHHYAKSVINHQEIKQLLTAGSFLSSSVPPAALLSTVSAPSLANFLKMEN